MGALLGSRSKENNVKELIIFLKPHVLNQVEEAGQMAQEQLEQLKHGDDIKRFTETGAFDTLKSLNEEEKGFQKRFKDWLGLQDGIF